MVIHIIYYRDVITNYEQDENGCTAYSQLFSRRTHRPLFTAAVDFNMLRKTAASLSGTSLNSLRISFVVGPFPLAVMRPIYFLMRNNKPLYFFVSASRFPPEVAELPLDAICILLF
mmetsp:Transcript_31977/g.59088  ORF Transcript_31977/g.59088 Transcript_31977/m.59088 type:complete len:116 (-) Transcript_31977:1787-2134(-)